MQGWAKIKTGAKYAGVSERTLRNWLKTGLRHVRLKTGTILIKYEWIDQYLCGYEVSENEVERITKDICKEFEEI